MLNYKLPKAPLIRIYAVFRHVNVGKFSFSVCIYNLFNVSPQTCFVRRIMGFGLSSYPGPLINDQIILRNIPPFVMSLLTVQVQSYT